MSDDDFLGFKIGLSIGLIMGVGMAIIATHVTEKSAKDSAVKANAAHYAHDPGKKEGVFTWGPAPTNNVEKSK
jgi:hypothetical protein